MNLINKIRVHVLNKRLRKIGETIARLEARKAIKESYINNANKMTTFLYSELDDIFNAAEELAVLRTRRDYLLNEFFRLQAPKTSKGGTQDAR